MKNSSIFAACLAAMFALCVSCSEMIEVKTSKSGMVYLAVEAILTDMPDMYQVVTLSESVDYFSDGQVSAPMVTDAVVSVSDGTVSVPFVQMEGGEPGKYYSPFGYRTEAGKTYTLSIDRKNAEGVNEHFSAQSTMIEPGLELTRVDYKNTFKTADSTWTIGVWLTDKPQTSNFLLSSAINGVFYPLDQSFSIDDKYFAGSTISGFPVNILSQTQKNRESLGACAKVPETGDIITLAAYTLPNDFFEFFTAFYLNIMNVSIPLLTPQPANIPTNISGDGPAVGYFATCPVLTASCVVDDPDRTEFLETPLLIVPPIPE